MKNALRNQSIIVASSAILAACLLSIVSHLSPGSFLQSLELDSYDWRTAQSQKFTRPPATNLAAVYLDDYTITNLSENYFLDFPYPRWVHGRVLRELSNRGAKTIAFDILFNDRRNDVGSPHQDVKTQKVDPSDEFMARQIRESGNVILASGKDSLPTPLFRTNAMAIAHIFAHKDRDGILRRIEPFISFTNQFGREQRKWHMGIALAAGEMGLDLVNAEVSPHEIKINSTNRSGITLPLDRNGRLLVDWSIRFDDTRIKRLRYDSIFEADDERQWRELAAADAPPAPAPTSSGQRSQMKGDLVIIGSIAEGNNVSDLGSTPVSIDTPLVITHLNIANMLLTNRFITQPGLGYELLLVVFLGALACLITLKTPATHAGLWILVIAALLVFAGRHLFIHLRIWLPLVTPIVGGLFLPYIALVTFRLIFEETEQERVKNVFKSIVSPNVVNELLSADRLSLGGARREITVFFADIRGFTQMTDSKQSRAEAHVRENRLPTEEAEAYFDKNSAEVLNTVNSYLALIADVIKKHDGTLDKYIGDCVMAFWGAPTPNEKHAVACVQAAIDAQRAIYSFNQERFRRNEQNKAAGVDDDKLDLLSLGTGINSGMATVGLMGSKEHISNYTVFGGAVNLASRMEGLSGRSRIFIGETTFNLLQKHAPDLANTCVLQPATTVKGIKTPITHYEVPWRDERPGHTSATK